MVLGAASFQVIPFTDTDPLLTFPQVSALQPFSCKFKSFRRKYPGLGADTSATGSLVVRAEALTQRSKPPGNRNSSQKPKAPKSFQPRKDLQSLRDALRQQVHGEDLRSYNDNPRQGLQRSRGYVDNPIQDLQTLKESSALHAGLQPKRAVGLEQKRHRLFLDPPGHLQRDGESTHTADLGSSHVEKNDPSIFDGNIGKNTQPTKRWGSRNSSRGLDVLDDLMSSQGRTSRAVLESLQSEVAFEKDEILNFRRGPVEDARVSPLSRSASTNEYTVGRQDSMSQTLSEFGRAQRWRPVYEDTTDTASTSSTFSTSLEKALSPSMAAKSSSGTSFSSGKASVLQQSIPSSHLERVSEVAPPALRGQEVLWALQKAAIEKAKQKQKNRKLRDRAPKGKEIASLHDSGEWRNAKPIVLKPEWALQIDDLEQRIENIKNPFS